MHSDPITNDIIERGTIAILKRKGFKTVIRICGQTFLKHRDGRSAKVYRDVHTNEPKVMKL